MATQYATIGTDGTRPVVWGAGTDPEESVDDAHINLIDAGVGYMEDLVTVEVTEAQAKEILDGVVSVKDLGIELTASWLNDNQG